MQAVGEIKDLVLDVIAAVSEDLVGDSLPHSDACTWEGAEYVEGCQGAAVVGVDEAFDDRIGGEADFDVGEVALLGYKVDPAWGGFDHVVGMMCHDVLALDYMWSWRVKSKRMSSWCCCWPSCGGSIKINWRGSV